MTEDYKDKVESSNKNKVKNRNKCRDKYRDKCRDKCCNMPKAGNKYTSDIKSMFASADALLPIDEDQKRSTLKRLRQEITDKEVLLVCSRRKIWLNQMRYADRSMFGFHILGCIVTLSLIFMMKVRRIDNESVIATFMILAGVLGSLSVLEVGKVCFAKLSELSETCLLNVRQLAAFDMVLSGIINLTVLSAGILFVGFHWKIWLFQIALYILVPFIFAQCVCLGVLLTETGRKNGWLTAAAGIFLSVFYAILASTPQLYTPSALFIWAIALVIGSIVLGMQTKALFTAINKGEILCTNWN